MRQARSLAQQQVRGKAEVERVVGVLIAVVVEAAWVEAAGVWVEAVAAEAERFRLSAAYDLSLIHI